MHFQVIHVKYVINLYVHVLYITVSSSYGCENLSKITHLVRQKTIAFPSPHNVNANFS